MMNSMLNHIRWIRTVFNSGRRTQQLFGARRNNRGGMLFSVLGLGIGATAYSLLRGRENGMQQMNQPIPNFLKNAQINTIGKQNQIALAEFSEELTTEPSKKVVDEFEDLF
ncbi:hypothetical protein ACFFHM_13375 [Halalkalibacter kiskunsagensis]|uniref:Uncharacterized protein n=1 Tax=Halalkalibacter kiskunsagensis TaxID=1548599 RepID=A0ABV6KDR8_9BACI